MNLSHAGDHNTVLLEEERRCRKGEFNNPKLFSARLREYGSHLCLTITEQPVIWDFSGYLEYVCLHDKDGNQWWGESVLDIFLALVANESAPAAVHDQFFEKQLRLDETSLDPTFTYRKDEKALQVMIHSPNNDSSESEDLSLTKHASRFPPLWTPDGRVLLTWYDQAGLQKGWRALRAIPGLPMTVSSIIPAWLMEAISQCHSSIKTQDFVDRQRPDLRSGVTPKTWDCRRRAARKKYNFVKEPASSYV
jgi:hypothetical protein